MASRLLIVSDRLPATARADDGLRLAPAGGGLAIGLRPWHEGISGRFRVPDHRALRHMLRSLAAPAAGDAKPAIARRSADGGVPCR